MKNIFENAERRNVLILILITIVFTALAVAYSLTIDLKGGPDETAHFIYIRSLALDHKLPDVSSAPVNSLDSQASHEAHQPPLYYAVMAIPYALLNWLGLSTEAIWQILRILGISFGVCWIFAVYRLCEIVLKSKGAGLAATAIVALIPTAIYMAGVVNNDMMIAMWFCWALVFMAKLQRDDTLERRSAVLLGLMIGAAILTKSQGLLLIPIFLLVAFFIWLRGKRRNSKDIASAILTVFLVAAIACGWWIVRSLVLYGSIQPELLNNPFFKDGFTAVIGFLPQFGSLVWMICVRTYMRFLMPFWLVMPFVNNPVLINTVVVLTALLVLGLIARMIFVRDLGTRSLGVPVLAFILVFASWFHYVLMVDFGANLQGRLFLPVAPIFGIMVVTGLEPWFKNRRLRSAMVIFAGVSLVLSNLLILRYAAAYYALGYG